MKIAAVIALAGLAACTPDRPASLPGPVGICKADAVQRYVGQPATLELVDKVRAESGAGTARRITPEMRVTMEFSEMRVNVWVGLKGEAERITCG